MSKILITGGDGYIGSHIAEICKHRYDIIDTKRNLDIRRNNALEGYSTVIHCAALSNVPECQYSPMLAYDINVYGTINLIKQMKEWDVDHIIFSSSCAYGQSHIYGKTKAMCEEIIQDSGLNYTILRYYNVAGAHGRIGENHNPETHIIPLAIEAAFKDKPFIVYGNDYNTPDGTAVRDFIHVMDVAEENLKYVNNPANKIIELGNGIGYSVLDIIKKVEEHSGKKINTIYRDRRDDVAMAVCGKVESGRRTIDDIISSAVEYYKRQTNMKGR